jgi:GNAT superfamily N-acetyltransferase
MALTVSRLTIAEFDQTLKGLLTLLKDAVNSGASLGYLAESPISEYENFWQKEFRDVQAGLTTILIARKQEHLAGVVCLSEVGKANQIHRAEVRKLLVVLDQQNQGIATTLMAEVEFTARAAGKSLLTLDTESNSAADYLYQKLGWQKYGVIPRYAASPNGTLTECSFYYKELPG